MPAQKEKDEFNLANLLQAQRDLMAGPVRTAPAAPSAPPGGSAGGGDDADAYVNLKHYYYLLCGRWWCVLLATVAVAGAAFYWRVSTPQKYQAVVKVDLNESLLGSGAELFGGRAIYVDTEALVNLAKKKEVLEKAAELLPGKLKELLAARSKGFSPDEYSAAERLVQNNPGMGGDNPVNTHPEKYSVVITVQAEGSQRLASLIAEARADCLGRALVKHFLDSVGSANRRKSIERLLKDNDQELQEINKALLAAALPREAGAEPTKGPTAGQELPAGMRELLDFIARQKRELSETGLQIAEVEDRIAKLKSFLDRPEQDDQQVSPEIQKRLADLHMQLAQLEDRYNPSHPKYQRIKDEIEKLTELKADKARDPNLTVNVSQGQLLAERYRAKIEKESLLARQEALKKSIEATRRDIEGRKGGLSAQAAEAMAHEEKLRQKQALEDMSVQLRRKLQEADVMVNIEKGQDNRPLAAVDRVDPARLVGASAWQVLGLAVILGLVLGVLLALLLEHLDDTVRSELVARRASGLPVINKLPLFAGEPGKRFISAGEPRSDVAEIFKVFHNHVRYAAPNGPERCLLITSPERGEGKSYVAINLALSFALEGNRVCLLDADLRRSRMHECLDVLRPRGAVDAGLCGYLEGALAVEDVVLPTDNENLSVILAGGRASNPPRALRSERMRALLEQLVREYDVVIIDTPPVLPVVDAAILAALVRSALLVVRFGTTHLGDLAEASARLAHVNAPLAGMVINGVHGVMGSYVYNYRYRYHYRYHYSTGAGYGGYGGQ